MFQKRKKETLDLKNTLQGTTLFFRMVALITKALEWLVTIVSDPVLRHSITFGTTIRMKPAVAQRVSILLLWRQWFTYGLWYTDRKSIVGAILQGRTNLFPLFVQFSLQWWLEIYQVQKSSSLFSPRLNHLNQQQVKSIVRFRTALWSLIPDTLE